MAILKDTVIQGDLEVTNGIGKLSLPDDDYTDYTSNVQATKTSFTLFLDSAPFDGWLICKTNVTNKDANYQCSFWNSTLDLRIQSSSYGYNQFGGCYIPVRKGDALYYIKESNVSIESCRLHKIRG